MQNGGGEKARPQRTADTEGYGADVTAEFTWVQENAWEEYQINKSSNVHNFKKSPKWEEVCSFFLNRLEIRESGSQLSTGGKPWRPRAHVDRGPGTSPGVACHAGRVRRVCKAKIGSLWPKGLPDDDPPVSYLPLIISKAQEPVDGFGDRNLQMCDDRSVADDPTSFCARGDPAVSPAEAAGGCSAHDQCLW